MSHVEMNAMSKNFLKTSTMEGWKVEIACVASLSLSLSLPLSLVVICNTFLALSLKEIESY
jgi:hypothetical protein